MYISLNSKKRLLCMLLLFFPIVILGKNINIYNLRIEGMNNPIGLDASQPHFSWMLQSDKSGVIQKAYHILVASSLEKLLRNEADLWDSGKVESDASQWITYAGEPLQSNQCCYWKVKCYTTRGAAWSTPSQWSMGLTNETEWEGEWIGTEQSYPWNNEKLRRLSARYLRREFSLKRNIKRAMVYVAGVGLHELYINGRRIGDRVLAPSPSDYRKTILYNTYDVTSSLSQKNAIGVILGNGKFYAPRAEKVVTTFGYPKMRFCMIIEYADGSRDKIVSDSTWHITTNGPIRWNNEYDGETYDARYELGSWTLPGYDETTFWEQANIVTAPGGRLTGTIVSGMKVADKIIPVSIIKKDNRCILDMGQNMVGWLRMSIRGKEGDTIRLRFAELLQEDGNLYVDNLRKAHVTDLYICNGKETNDMWAPRFTYHGFRYVEVTGLENARINDFVGEVVNDEMETLGTFETSNAILNQVYKNAFWGIRGNYKGVPVDCPQRDERQPWLGDRTVGAWGESFVFNNERLYSKWMRDICEAQAENGTLPDVAPVFWKIAKDNITWPAALPIICDMLYTQYGNEQPIRECYDAIYRWMNHLYTSGLTSEGTITKDYYGDWCVPPEALTLIHSKDPARKTDGELIATAYYIKIAQTMCRFAGIIGKEKDKAVWNKQIEEMIRAFNHKYLKHSEGKVYYSNNTVTANILPLAFDIVPEEKVKPVVKNLRDVIVNTNQGHISCGVIGVQWLMRELSKRGLSDIAYELATHTTYPSWGYMVEKGATTIWELWNGDAANPAMNSRNHVMLLGDLLLWCYEDLAGIYSDRQKVGFKHTILRPKFNINKLTYVNASYITPYGKLLSNWKKENGKLVWYVEIPPNATAEAHFPNGKVVQLKSGKYNWNMEL